MINTSYSVAAGFRHPSWLAANRLKYSAMASHRQAVWSHQHDDAIKRFGIDRTNQSSIITLVVIGSRETNITTKVIYFGGALVIY